MLIDVFPENVIVDYDGGIGASVDRTLFPWKSFAHLLNKGHLNQEKLINFCI